MNAVTGGAFAFGGAGVLFFFVIANGKLRMKHGKIVYPQIVDAVDIVGKLGAAYEVGVHRCSGGINAIGESVEGAVLPVAAGHGVVGAAGIHMKTGTVGTYAHIPCRHIGRIGCKVEIAGDDFHPFYIVEVNMFGKCIFYNVVSINDKVTVCKQSTVVHFLPGGRVVVAVLEGVHGFFVVSEHSIVGNNNATGSGVVARFPKAHGVNGVFDKCIVKLKVTLCQIPLGIRPLVCLTIAPYLDALPYGTVVSGY